MEEKYIISLTAKELTMIDELLLKSARQMESDLAWHAPNDWQAVRDQRLSTSYLHLRHAFQYAVLDEHAGDESNVSDEEF
jgi:hypothetical protein